MGKRTGVSSAWSTSIAALVVLTACSNDGTQDAAAPAASIVGVERLLGGPAYEPTLAITPQGNLFYTGGTPHNDATLYPGTGWVLASYDKGGASK